MNIDFNMVLLAFAPALVVALISFFSIKSMLQKETLKQKFQLLKSNQKEVLPLKLQAYERLTLLLDRVSLEKLVVRVQPIGDDINDYKQLLIANINQEFEHNLTQQMYVSDECWSTILKTKQVVVSQIIKQDEDIDTATKFREITLAKNELDTPSSVAQSFIRNEVAELF